MTTANVAVERGRTLLSGITTVTHIQELCTVEGYSSPHNSGFLLLQLDKPGGAVG